MVIGRLNVLESLNDDSFPLYAIYKREGIVVFKRLVLVLSFLSLGKILFQFTAKL